MKKILYILFLSVAPCIYSNAQFGWWNIGPQTWNSGPPYTFSYAYGVNVAGSGNVTVNGNANVDIISGTEVDMVPGFTAGSFPNDEGKYIAQIAGGSTVPIFLLSPDYGTTNICTFQRVEIGVGIPPVQLSPTNLQFEIDNFIYNPTYPPYPSWVINPYDPNEVYVTATFTAVDPNGHTQSYTRPGFYYQDVSVTNPVSATENFQVTDDPDYPFRVRFAPPFAGSWNVTVTFSLPNKNLSYTSLSGNFLVVNCGNQGFISTQQYSSDAGEVHNWHFCYDANNYGSGATFFPIGQDIEGPIHDGYAGWDGILSHRLTSNPNPSVIVGGFDMSADDYAYSFHRNEISNFASAGGNMFRMVMMWAGYGIDDGSPVINDYDPVSSYELDKTLQLAESDNLYVLLSIESQANLSYNRNFIGDNSEYWGGQNTNLPGVQYWNPYYDYLVNVEGMTYPDVSYFFTDPNLIQFYEDKLLYMQARWGYSPNIFGYEIFGEIDQVGCTPPPEPNPLNIQATYEYATSRISLMAPISNWTNTMINYIHSIYPFHLATVSYASGPHIETAPALSDYTPNYIDFLEQHSYTSTVPENSDREDYMLQQYFYSPQNYSNTIEKPRIFGEEGPGSCPNAEKDNGCSDVIVRHNDEWSSAFSTSGAGFYWGTDFDPITNMTDYNHISTFFNYLSTNLHVNFHNTDFSPINQYFWGQAAGSQSAWQNFCLVDANAKPETPNDQSPASAISSAVGWIVNISYNWQYDPSLCNLGCGNPYSSFGPALSPELNEYEWPGDYYTLYVWDPYLDYLVSTTTYTTGLSGDLDFPIALGTTPYSSLNEPDYAYYIYKTGQALSPEPSADGYRIIRLPNDTVYLPSDSLSFPGTHSYPVSKGSFNWDFGNGATSNNSNPKWIYNSIGNYDLSVKYADSTKKFIIERTYIVLQNEKTPLVIDSSFAIVPNPTSGMFQVVSTHGVSVDEIDIEDAAGRRCFSELNPKSNIFNISSLAAGVYLVTIHSSGMIVTKKLLKYD